MLKEYLGKLGYLILPEDTTGDVEMKVCSVESRSCGCIKVVFWLTVSITISIGIGQLQ